jgi:hypothetical protein
VSLDEHHGVIVEWVLVLRHRRLRRYHRSWPGNQPDIVMLEKILQFLLSRVGTSLGSIPLLSLLSLGLADAELALGLDFEKLWKVSLTCSNIIILFRDFFASYDASPAFEVDLGEIDLIIPATQHLESPREQPGRNILRGIISMVLKSSLVCWVECC